jgi:hypothetical protein
MALFACLLSSEGRDKAGREPRRQEAQMNEYFMMEWKIRRYKGQRKEA